MRRQYALTSAVIDLALLLEGERGGESREKLLL
jgi:hypothetical protein